MAAIQLTLMQLFIALALAISAIAAFVNTYDAAVDLRSYEPVVEETDELKKVMNTRFWVFTIISLVLFVVGFGIYWFRRNKPNRSNVVSYGFMSAGILGIIFTFTNSFRRYSYAAKLAVSWIALIVFFVLAIFLSKGVSKLPDSSFKRSAQYFSLDDVTPI